MKYPLTILATLLLFSTVKAQDLGPAIYWPKNPGETLYIFTDTAFIRPSASIRQPPPVISFGVEACGVGNNFFYFAWTKDNRLIPLPPGYEISEAGLF